MSGLSRDWRMTGFKGPKAPDFARFEVALDDDIIQFSSEQLADAQQEMGGLVDY